MTDLLSLPFCSAISHLVLKLADRPLITRENHVLKLGLTMPFCPFPSFSL